jgi:chitinase
MMPTTLSLLILLVLIKYSLQQKSYIFPCYYVYEPQLLKPEQIPPFNLCTHIIILGCIEEKVNQTYPTYLVSPYDCSIVLNKLSNLKLLNPDLKVVLSMGTNVDAMHYVVQNDESIDNFTSTAIQLALQFNFDGLDFDWEYPCEGDDRFKFTKFLQNLRYKIGIYRLKLTISAAIGAGINILKKCYDLNGLSSNLDYINVMCYDYNTIYNNYTAYASPLFARPEETGYDATLNTNYTINYLIDNNVPREKIVLGLNAGGHTFQLSDPQNKHDFHAPVLGVGYSSGWSTYPQLCEFIKNGKGVYDKTAEVLYAYYDDQWSNTGDVRSALAKSIYAKKMNLAGVFTWCLNWDDLFNVCGQNVTFPIHRTIRSQLFA